MLRYKFRALSPCLLHLRPICAWLPHQTTIFNIMLRLNILAIYFALATAQSQSTTTAPTASIPAGKLVGNTCSQNPQAAQFLAVPYAQPPTGNLRFEPPQAYNQTYTGGTRNATTPTTPCIQFGSDQEATPWSEDWLGHCATSTVESSC